MTTVSANDLLKNAYHSWCNTETVTYHAVRNGRELVFEVENAKKMNLTGRDVAFVGGNMTHRDRVWLLPVEKMDGIDVEIDDVILTAKGESYKVKTEADLKAWDTYWRAITVLERDDDVRDGLAPLT